MRWVGREKRPQKKAAYVGTTGFTYGRSSGYNGGDWSPQRAMTDAMDRVTWVFRAVDAIASNAARLPFAFKEQQKGSDKGPDIDDHPLSLLMNRDANEQENSFAFRYRMSAQLLLSSKGVFIEVIRNNAGDVIALQLFDPTHVFPDVDEASGKILRYMIRVPGRKDVSLKPERVIWLRKSHPFDPYRALTPLNPAGLAIETDWFARLYNRNFLLNDGRPGGMIVVKGEMDEVDKEELRRRYAGNLANAGRISVIASDDGADFVDTAVTPRDAQYDQTRKLTKEEILMSFGVPESVLANAAGRTFDNAEQERLIFWMETMLPHLKLIERALDVLDPERRVFAGFDLSGVDVIQRAEIKRREFLLRELEQGAISVNEYRLETNRAIIEGGNRMYMAHTRKVVATDDGEWVADFPMNAEDVPADPGGRPPNDYENFNPDDDEPADPAGDSAPSEAKAPPVETKEDVLLKSLNERRDQMVADISRWETVIELGLKRYLTRQRRVVHEKLTGAKTRKKWELNPGSVNAAAIFDRELWYQQLQEDMEPLLKGVAEEFGRTTAGRANSFFDVDTPSVKEAIQEQLSRVVAANHLILTELEMAIRHVHGTGGTVDDVVDAIERVYDNAPGSDIKTSIRRVVTACANAAKLGFAEVNGLKAMTTKVSGGDLLISDPPDSNGKTLVLVELQDGPLA